MASVPTPNPTIPAAEAERAATPSAARRLLGEVGDLASFAGQSLASLGGTFRYTSEILRQTAILVRGTTLFLAVMQVFFGFTIVNYAFFFFRTIGASDYVGVTTGLAGVRLGCIAMFAYVFASKVCCAVVAEIGAAKISEEIDAYETEGVDPYKYIIGTRVAAALLYIPIAAMVSLAALSFGGYLNSVVVLNGLTAEQFYSVHWAVMSLSDVFYMCITIGTTGVALILVACFYGFRTSGGPEAVGQAVARSLIVNITLAHLIPAFWTMTFYSPQNPALNIGGG